MNPDTKARLLHNLACLPRMASVWATGIVSLLASFWVALPPAQQQAALAMLPVPKAAVPWLVVMLPIVIARAWPQRAIPPAPAAPPLTPSQPQKPPERPAA